MVEYTDFEEDVYKKKTIWENRKLEIARREKQRKCLIEEKLIKVSGAMK